MKGDAFSDARLPGWMRISAIGLVVSAGAWVFGGWARDALQGNLTTPGIVGRLVAAAVHGFGMGFGVLFLFLTVTGMLYWLLHRR
jgi:hypothetical protein